MKTKIILLLVLCSLALQTPAQERDDPDPAIAAQEASKNAQIEKEVAMRKAAEQARLAAQMDKIKQSDDAKLVDPANLVRLKIAVFGNQPANSLRGALYPSVALMDDGSSTNLYLARCPLAALTDYFDRQAAAKNRVFHWQNELRKVALDYQPFAQAKLDQAAGALKAINDDPPTLKVWISRTTFNGVRIAVCATNSP
jgi:hypothetical protein